MKARIALVNRQWRDSRQRSWHRSLIYAGGILVLCGLMMLLSACTNPFFTPSKTGANQTPTPETSPVSAVSPTPTPVPPNITLQVVNCPTLSINWDSLVGTKPHVNKVQKVICGSLEGSGSLDAVVNVRYYSPDAKLDFYVYDNLYGAPNRLYSVQSLLNGDTQISPTGTLMTGEIGPGDALKGALDVFKEYSWNGATFTRDLFPGFYPDMTHYQAEQDQAIVTANQAKGISSSKTSAYSVVGELAVKIFHWNPQMISIKPVTYSTSRATYIFGVNNLAPGGGGFVANLFRLDNVSTNIFEVQQISSLSGNTVLSSPSNGVQLSSPVSVSGSALASGSILGHVVVYDDTYITVGDSGEIHSPTTSGLVNFTSSINYHLNAQGMLEGALVFFSTSQNNIALSNEAVMVKVFLTA